MFLQPQLGSDGDWKGVFFSALKTLLRETLYTRDDKQREVDVYTPLTCLFHAYAAFTSHAAYRTCV